MDTLNNAKMIMYTQLGKAYPDLGLYQLEHLTRMKFGIPSRTDDDQQVTIKLRIPFVEQNFEEQNIEYNFEIKPYQKCKTKLKYANNCVICHELFTELQDIPILTCNHDFHLECLIRWLEKDICCPLCRKKISK